MKCNLQCNRVVRFFIVVFALIMITQYGTAQEVQKPDTTQAQFGGPGSVQGQEAEDRKAKTSVFEVGEMPAYSDWKDKLREKHALTYTVDYSSAVFTATNTLNSDNLFASGALRFYGSWSPVGRKSGNTGSFIWKVENRHGYTDVPASGTAGEIGYVGLFLPTFSNIGTRLTNLYWKQNLIQGRIEIVGGFIDVTDWVDLYALASPWNGFFNLAQATGSATMFLPDDATIGVYVNSMITDNLYVIGGIADANSVSTDPFNGFETFFKDNEYFTSLELGWVKSQDRFYFNNTHITYWHVDEREKAGIASAWGLNFSSSYTFDLKWMPYLRAGISSKGGGWLLQKSVSAGLGYHLKDGVSLFGLGLNWSQPSEDSYGPGLENQFSTELFCRFKLLQNLELTPNIQWIVNPALNTAADQSLVLGLRGRVFF